MATLRLNGYETQGTQVRREFKETLATNVASTEVVIPHGMLPTVRLIGFDGAGRTVQFTTSPESDIAAGTATWSDRPFGVIIGNGEGRLAGAVTGLRLSTTGGAGTWEICA